MASEGIGLGVAVTTTITLTLLTTVTSLMTSLMTACGAGLGVYVGNGTAVNSMIFIIGSGDGTTGTGVYVGSGAGVGTGAAVGATKDALANATLASTVASISGRGGLSPPHAADSVRAISNSIMSIDLMPG